jgi:hypothetical protein
MFIQWLPRQSPFVWWLQIFRMIVYQWNSTLPMKTWWGVFTITVSRHAEFDGDVSDFCLALIF